MLGGYGIAEKGFEIGGECIACGTCQSVCPQGCIDDGDIYFINREHCLHCGNCFENCPANAIAKKGV